jgi:hypothetical protein
MHIHVYEMTTAEALVYFAVVAAVFAAALGLAYYLDKRGRRRK